MGSIVYFVNITDFTWKGIGDRMGSDEFFGNVENDFFDKQKDFLHLEVEAPDLLGVEKPKDLKGVLVEVHGELD